MKQFKLSVLILAAMSFAWGAIAESQSPYVFVQGHSGSTQSISENKTIQVQLPIGTKNWSLDGDSRNVAVVQRSLFPSPGRIPDSTAVQVFDLEIIEGGPAYVVFTSYGPPSALPGFVGQGRFELTLLTAGN